MTLSVDDRILKIFKSGFDLNNLYPKARLFEPVNNVLFDYGFGNIVNYSLLEKHMPNQEQEQVSEKKKRKRKPHKLFVLKENIENVVNEYKSIEKEKINEIYNLALEYEEKIDDLLKSFLKVKANKSLLSKVLVARFKFEKAEVKMIMTYLETDKKKLIKHDKRRVLVHSLISQWRHETERMLME